MSTYILKKITPKSVTSDLLKTPDSERRLFAVIGIVQGVEKGVSQFGEWKGLVGSFRAYRENGAEYVSNRLILPEPLNSTIYEAHVSSNQDIEIAVAVSIVPPSNEKGKAEGKYEFRTEVLQQMAMSQSLKNLESHVQKWLGNHEAPRISSDTGSEAKNPAASTSAATHHAAPKLTRK